MPQCKACNGTGSVVHANEGRVVCQVCRGTGNVVDSDRAAISSAMGSDAIGCVVGLLLGALLAYGGYRLGYQLGGTFGANNLGVPFTPDSKIALYGSIGGGAVGFLLGFGISRLIKSG